MRIKGPALVLAVLLAAAAAEGAEIRGRVVGAGRNPIAGAVVLHRPSGLRAETGPDGRFVLELPDAARFDLEITHGGHYGRTVLLGAVDLGREAEFTLSPLIRQSEEVVVTALRYPESSMSVPAAGQVVSGETLSEAMHPTVSEGLRDVPGVGTLGSGGFALVPSVRGLARRRVLYLVDGARIESDRRTGPNASFVSPEDIERIEVLRSASSVLYGSDAIGGVIHVMTRSPRHDGGLHGRFLTGYGTANGEKRLGLGLDGSTGAWAFSLSVQQVDAGEYRAPDGTEILQSQYRQGSLLAKVSHATEDREVDIGFLAARGTDIGKPSVNAATRPTRYPREDQNLFRLSWREKNVGRDGEVLFHAFANPNFLETLAETRDEGALVEEAFARTDSAEFGAQLSYARRLWPALRLEGGLDYFGRGGADAFNSYTSYDGLGAVTDVVEEHPYTGGRRGDLGVFLSADYAGIRRLDILGGVRYGVFRMRAVPSGAASPVVTEDAQPAGFLAVSYRLADDVTAFVNLARAFRLPSLNELYYTGITGRGTVIGQPGLGSESSLNLDGGIKVLGRRSFLGLYAFRTRVDDMIERYQLDATTFTYGNIERGLLRGLELEAETFVLPGWKVFGNAAAIRGRSLATGEPLNDVPPLRLYAGTRYWKGRFSAEVNATFGLAKGDPGPAEVAVAASEVVNLKAAYFGKGLNVYLALGNVFNAAYIARADSDAMPEPGRNLRLGFAYAF